MMPGLPCFSPPFHIRVLLSTETEEEKKRGRPGNEARVVCIVDASNTSPDHSNFFGGVGGGGGGGGGEKNQMKLIVLTQWCMSFNRGSVVLWFLGPPLTCWTESTYIHVQLMTLFLCLLLRNGPKGKYVTS